MKAKLKSERAFTLIELLVASTIFVTFMVVAGSLVINLLQAQTKANTMRTTQQSARYIMETIIREARSANGEIDGNGVRWTPSYMFVRDNGDFSPYGKITTASGVNKDRKEQIVSGFALYQTSKSEGKVIRKVFWVDSETGVLKERIDQAAFQAKGGKISSFTKGEEVALNDPSSDIKITSFILGGSFNSDPLPSNFSPLPPYLNVGFSAESSKGAGGRYGASVTLQSSATPRNY